MTAPRLPTPEDWSETSPTDCAYVMSIAVGLVHVTGPELQQKAGALGFHFTDARAVQIAGWHDNMLRRMKEAA